MWHPDGPQGDESRKINHLVAHYTRGRGLDIGCGPYKLWPTVIGLDAAGADITADGTKLTMFGNDELDFVYSSHFLEHVPDPLAALREWWRVIKPDGYLTLYLPHDRLYPRMGQPGANPDHKHDLNEAKVLAWLYQVVSESFCGAQLVECEIRDFGDGLDEFSEYSFLIVLQKRTDTIEFLPYEPPLVPREKRVLVVRYGGYGDALIASSAFPGLKAQGLHLTVNCTPAIWEVLRENPYIDDFILQDKGQVPDGDFIAIYLDRMQERFGRVIPLFWEAGLLPDRGSIQWLWPQGARHRLMNVNYMERVHDLCEVPQADYDCRFYGAPTEVTFDPYDGPTIAWAVAGSGDFKLWPHISQAVVQLLYRTNARILLLGADSAQPLQQVVLDSVRAWYGRTGHRVLGGCGHTDMRGACAAAMGADVVVGPETGILNAVATLPMPKVLLLSHSTPENLCKHWVNAIPLIPSTPDYPDHRLHGARVYDKYRSPLDLRRDLRTQSPELAAGISVEQVVDGVLWALKMVEAQRSPKIVLEGLRDDHELHDAGGRQDDVGLDPELDEPEHGSIDGGADGGASLDLPEAPGAGDALLHRGDAGAGGLPDRAAGAVSGDGAVQLHQPAAAGAPYVNGDSRGREAAP